MKSRVAIHTGAGIDSVGGPALGAAPHAAPKPRALLVVSLLGAGASGRSDSRPDPWPPPCSSTMLCPTESETAVPASVGVTPVARDDDVPPYPCALPVRVCEHPSAAHTGHRPDPWPDPVLASSVARKSVAHATPSWQSVVLSQDGEVDEASELACFSHGIDPPPMDALQALGSAVGCPTHPCMPTGALGCPFIGPQLADTTDDYLLTCADCIVSSDFVCEPWSARSAVHPHPAGEGLGACRYVREYIARRSVVLH